MRLRVGTRAGGYGGGRSCVEVFAVRVFAVGVGRSKGRMS